MKLEMFMFAEGWFAVDAYEYVGDAGTGGSWDGEGDGGRLATG